MAEAQYAKTEAPEQKPHFHESSRAFLEQAAAIRRGVKPEAQVQAETDPLRSFELDRTANTADLRLWNSFSEIDKIRKLNEIVKQTAPKQRDMDEQRKKMLDSRRRQLCAVIWMETDLKYKNGPKVARTAMDILFPVEK